METAVFGGGCFWCTEAVFEKLKGVVSVAPGYAGGTKENPTYEQVCGGQTGHAEVIKIEFDPKQIAYRDLLTVFFATHDPTTKNRQGPDVGSQYRSIILYSNENQKREAEEYMQKLGISLTTELQPLGKFFEAEDYHKQYYQKNSSQPYCQVVIAPKLLKIQNLYRVVIEKGTEAPFSGKYVHTKDKGIYKCAICGNELFSSDTKFDSGTGWPSFTEPANLKNVELKKDLSEGMERTEVLCKKCGAHLGHVFNDGPADKGGKRYCINSVCLELKREA